ncbi:MAG: transporter substrate-binding domain-containing protein [Actinomycetota bacterium]
MSRSSALSIALALIMLSGGCVPPEEEIVLARDYSDASQMGQVQERGKLIAGVAAGLPEGTGPGGDGPGAVEGFMVDLATSIADTLDVDLVIEHASSDDLLELVEDGEIDVAFPLTPVTEKLARRAGPTDPYIVAHQRLLVPTKSGIDKVDDLTSEAVVCPLQQEEMQVSLPDLDPSIETIEQRDPAGCVSALEKGRAEVVTGPELDLVRIHQAIKGYAITGEALTTAGYSIVVGRDTGTWKGFVEGVLGRYKSEGRWLISYNRWLAPYLGRDAEPPRMTVEEAAALYPRDL